MKFAIGCDHAGIWLKDDVIEYLEGLDGEIYDFGTHSTAKVDYPVYAYKVANAVASGKADKGILLCGTGIGMAIAANKVKGIRAAMVDDEFCATMCAEHNDVNVLCLGARVVSSSKAIKLIHLWLNTSFAGGRHQNRLDLISAIENGEMK